MQRVEYQSTVSIKPDDLSLLDMIRECDQHNSAQIVTGFLRYDGKRFHHVMEGPNDVIIPLFETLRWDPRHHKVVVENYSSVEEREYSGFIFQYVASISPASPARATLPVFALVQSNLSQLY